MAIPPELSGQFSRGGSSGKNQPPTRQQPTASSSASSARTNSARTTRPLSGSREEQDPRVGQTYDYYPPAASAAKNAKAQSGQSGRVIARVPGVLWGVANRPIAPAGNPGYADIGPIDRLDFFLHAIGLGGLAALCYGAWLTQSALGGLAGWVVALSLTIGQAYFRRVGWTPLNIAGFGVLLFLDSYFNIIGLIRDKNYTFDFRPLNGVLWKSTEKVPQIITTFEWTVYLIVAVMIAGLAEPALMYWWARIRGR